MKKRDFLKATECQKSVSDKDSSKLSTYSELQDRGEVLAELTNDSPSAALLKSNHQTPMPQGSAGGIPPDGKAENTSSNKLTFQQRIYPIIRRLCSYIVPRAKLFPAEQVKNVPHKAPFDSAEARIAAALRRYAEQIVIPEEIINSAKPEHTQDCAGSEDERAIIQQLIERELTALEEEDPRAEQGSGTAPSHPPWRRATHTLILERLGY